MIRISVTHLRCMQQTCRVIERATNDIMATE